MALLYKQLSPLHGVWKMEESSDELLGMLEHKADYSSFLERVSAEKRRQERFASRVLLKEYRSDRILKIRSRFMNPEEEAGIDLEHEVEHLLIHWCAKETLFKIIGQEGVDFQKHLHVNPFPYLSSGTFKGRETRTEACREYELAYQVTPDYVLTWLK